MPPIPVFAARRLPADTRAATSILDHALRCGSQILPGPCVQAGFRTRQYALCLVLEGRGELELAGQRHVLAPGLAFQRFPERSHTLRMPQGGAWCFLALPAAALEVLRSLGLPSALTPTFPAPASPALLRRWRSTADLLRDCPEARLATAAAELLRLAVDVHLAAQAAPPPAQERFARQACALLERDLERRVNLTAVAQELGVGLAAFRKSFHAACGCGPHAWRVRRRLAMAEELLADATLSVAEVARRLGYADAYAFSHQFRRHTGRSPQRFRSMLG